MSLTVHTLDLLYLGIPKALAAFVLTDARREVGPMLIETGPASTLAALDAGLRATGVALDDVRNAVVTHIHLDHAGAAGHLAQRGTTIWAHEFGAKHLVDPVKLIDSATRIYGEQTQRLWGTIVPVPESRIRAVRDGDTIDADGVRLRAIETPGHARHHHAFVLETQYEKTCFAGDAAGFNARAVSPTYLSVPTPPPEFDLDAWLSSIDRLQREGFDALYLTHFGRVNDVERHWLRLRETLIEHAAFIGQRHLRGEPREVVLQAYLEWNQRDAARHGIGEADFERYVTRNLLTMNVDGMLRYWQKRDDARSSGPQPRPAAPV